MYIEWIPLVQTNRNATYDDTFFSFTLLIQLDVPSSVSLYGNLSRRKDPKINFYFSFLLFCSLLICLSLSSVPLIARTKSSYITRMGDQQEIEKAALIEKVLLDEAHEIERNRKILIIIFGVFLVSITMT